MASFQFTNHEDISKAVGICELKVQSTPLSHRRNNFNSAVWSVAFAPDRSRFAWSSGNRSVQILPWNAAQHAPIAEPSSIVFYNNHVNVSQNGTNMNYENVNFENIEQVERNAECHQGMERDICIPKVKSIDCGDIVMSLAFGSSSPNKKLRRPNVKYRMYEYLDSNTELILAMGLKSGKIKTYDLGKDVMLHLMDHKDGIRDLAFSPDGSLMLISASFDQTLKVWDLKDDGNMVKTLKDHNKPVISCCFSPNGQMMASVGHNKVAILWEMTNYTIIHRLIGHHHNIVSCQFSSDGALLGTASWDARVCVWDPYTGDILQELHHVFPPLPTVFAGGANNNFVRCVAFSPDGSHIATVCDDKYVRFWSLFDTSDPQAVLPLENALTCCYHPDGSVLAAGTRAGEVKFIMAPMKINKLQHLCRLTIRKAVQDTRKLEQFRRCLPEGIFQYLAYRDIATEKMQS